MSALDPADDLAVSIRVAEPELATRLSALIEQTAGLRIAKPNEPGDLVLTGTPAGVGPLKAGDRVEVSAAGLGVLANTVNVD